MLGREYGEAPRKSRQSYWCYPNWAAEDKASRSKGRHRFTPVRPREHVHAGEDHCAICEEERTVHNGEQAVARRHTWDRRTVAKALEKLAEGQSYGKVAAWADAAGQRRRARTVPAPVGPITGKHRNIKAQQARNRWHTAADWVEVFGPVLFAAVDARLRAQALAERARLDAMLAAGADLDLPQVVVIDDVPVNARVKDPATGVRHSQRLYFVLVLAEVHWLRDPASPGGVRPDLRLRLARAFANNGHLAWKLLFSELGYTPDFVLADAGTGLVKAVSQFWPTTRFLPSLWHVQDAVREGLMKTPDATVLVEGQRQLRPELTRHLGGLMGDRLRNLDAARWTQWWDDLQALLVSLSLPVEKTRLRRGNYETLVAARLADLAQWPFLPLATGGLENLLTTYLTPILAKRKHGFANIERTNSLLDLVVCRAEGLFTHEHAVLDLLRQDLDTASAYGWAPPVRSVSDTRTPSGRTTSLWDPALLTALAAQRKLT